MMLRRGGKRIRMDDPPPEFDNPMTPADVDTSQGDPQEGLFSDVDMFGEDTYDEPAEEASSFDTSFQTGVSYNSSKGSDLSESPSHAPPPPAPRRRGRKPMDPAARTRKEQTAAAAAAIATSEAPPDEPPATRRRGRAAASAATVASSSTATTSKKTAEPRGEEDDNLYNAVLAGKSSLQQLVDDWIDDYKVNRDSTLLRLMQFFVSGSGCKGKITSQMQTTMEHAAIIRKMTEEFDEDSGEYPLVMSGQQWKKFRQNFCDFVQTLVKQCQYSIIYDQYLMDNVISLLTGLSDSQVRAFRHTASLAAMKLMTALVDVALTVSINLDSTQRQYESERQKSTGKRATDRLETLMGKRQELEENMDEIKNVLTYMFKSVFVHRYRDTLPEIRAICMSEIGIWMKKFHQNFLDDSYLKYIGWTLHDKIGEVRLKCLQALQPLYATEELKGKLELFTSKFKDRIVAMTLDKEYDVAVQAVKLVISIHKYHREILTDKDCELVYELVYSSHRAVAQAAGEFLNERLFVLDESAVENVRTARGKQRQANTPLIRDLVQFFIESELHEHGAYLVDSLIESNPMMKDWECMTDLLLELPGPHEDTLDDKQETSLIEIMVCSVRQCATGEPPIGRGPTRKILSAKELKQVSDDKNRLTEHFIPTLPALLSKYKADSDKVTNLLSLPQFFDLEIYTTSRQEKSLDKLLDLIKTVTEQHVEVDVLEVAAKSLEIICCDDARKSSRTEVALMNTLESIWEKFVAALADYDNASQDGGEPNQDEIYTLTMSLRKIAVFFGCHSFDKWNVWSGLFNIVRSTMDEQSMQYPEDAVKDCIASCYFALLWDLKSIQEKGEAGVTGMDDVPRLHRKLHNFMDAMKFLVAQSTWPAYKDEAYTSICDCLIVFCEQLGTNKWMETLIYQPDTELQRLLNTFMQVNVFCEVREDDFDEHAKIELLHKRRNYLAQFCKLIVYNVMPTSAAADVFKYYVKYYNDYGDIIKATLGKSREINKVNCALTMIMSLTNLYIELPKVNNWMVDRQHDEFIALKDLAKRFALSFGLDAVKNRDAITALHREGILLSVNPLENPNDPTGPPPNLAFLEILSEFTNKLLKQDKRVVLQYLDHRVGSATPSSQGGHWQPLYAYQNSLMHGETDHPPQTARRAYTRKRAAADEDEGHEEADDMGEME